MFDQFATIDQPVAKYGAKDCYDEQNALPTPQKAAAGATAVDISAKEYQFTIPDGIKAGKAAFTLTDKGNEMHVFALTKLKPGATFDQLKQAALSDQDPSKFADDQGTTAFTGPGKSNILNANLTAGTYVALCFISAPNGKPHLQLGMLQQFTVS